MKTPRTKIASTVAELTMKSGISDSLAREIAAYILEQGRSNDLDSILRDVAEYWSQKGYVNATVVCAHSLSDQAKDDIKKWLKTMYPNAHALSLSERVDPELIGGVRLELPNQQLDLSIQAKLNQFKQSTMSGKDV